MFDWNLKIIQIKIHRPFRQNQTFKLFGTWRCAVRTWLPLATWAGVWEPSIHPPAALPSLLGRSRCLTVSAAAFFSLALFGVCGRGVSVDWFAASVECVRCRERGASERDKSNHQKRWTCTSGAWSSWPSWAAAWRWDWWWARSARPTGPSRPQCASPTRTTRTAPSTSDCSPDARASTSPTAGAQPNSKVGFYARTWITIIFPAAKKGPGVPKKLLWLLFRPRPLLPWHSYPFPPYIP